MDIVFDAETFGSFNQHHPEFRNLFLGFMDETGKMIQTDDKEKIMLFLQEK